MEYIYIYKINYTNGAVPRFQPPTDKNIFKFGF